jgi:5-methylthioadenosine/S-adenosylhomocysteine deaminase
VKAFSADWVCPVAGPPLHEATLVLEHGRVVEVRPGRLAEAEDFPGCALTPGFVNAHTHLELTVFRGLLEGLSFVDWIRTLTRLKYDVLTPEDLRVSARLGAAECLAAGVTAVGEVMDLGDGWTAMLESGLRGVAYQEVFGPDPADADGAVAKLEARLSTLGETKPADPAQRLGVSPHAPYTVSEPLYEKVRDLARRRHLFVAVHVGESVEEGDFVRKGEGAFARGLAERGIPVIPRGKGPLAYLDGLGILGPGTLAIHAVDANTEEIRRLGETGAAVAHCPKSNLELGHGIAPVREMLDAGVTVGLGTDSVASNDVVDMFEEMRTAIFMQRQRRNDQAVLTAREAFEMATLGGARALGLEREIGSLEAGKRADFVVVDLGEAATTPVYDPVDAMVFAASRRNVRQAFLSGEPVAPFPLRLLEDAQAIAERLGRFRSDPNH